MELKVCYIYRCTGKQEKEGWPMESIPAGWSRT